MPLTREQFRAELDELGAMVEDEALAVTGLLREVMAAINRRDSERADVVIAGDDRVDELHVALERKVEWLLAMEAPVATDLRLILAVLHINLHLERMGDQCVNIAKVAKLTFEEAPLPIDLMVTFAEMATQ